MTDDATRDPKIPPGAEEAVAEGLTGDDSVPIELRIQGSEDPGRDNEHLSRMGAYTFDRTPDSRAAQPEEHANPAGVGRGSCDEPSGESADADASCDLEVTAQVGDIAAQETKPGFGIPGYDGEESGGA